MTRAGIGFRSGATVQSVRDALSRAGGSDLRGIAVPAAKAGDPLIADLAANGFAITAIPAETLASIETPTRGRASQQAHATGSVAEACALAAAGPGARLLAPRSVSADRMATAAVAVIPKGNP